MKNILSLSKRNCLLFLRSPQVFFSSLISSIILITLYFLFVANLYSQGFNEAAGLALTAGQLDAAIYLQMIMGVLVINSVSLSTGMFTFMAYDFEEHKTEAFLLTKISSAQITLSYLISALTVSFALNLLTLVVSVIIIGAVTGVWISAGAFFAIFGVLIITTMVGCAIMLLITTAVRSSVAIGVISGIVGTILGFLCGIYMPYSNLGEGAIYVGSLLPFTHLVIWLKQIVLGNVFSQFGMPDDISQIMQEKWFSAGNVGLCGADIPLWGMILYSIIFAIICFVVSMFLIKSLYKNRKHQRVRKTKAEQQ